jgi:hypothetical protein
MARVKTGLGWLVSWADRVAPRRVVFTHTPNPSRYQLTQAEFGAERPSLFYQREVPARKRGKRP